MIEEFIAIPLLLYVPRAECRKRRPFAKSVIEEGGWVVAEELRPHLPEGALLYLAEDYNDAEIEIDSETDELSACIRYVCEPRVPERG